MAPAHAPGFDQGAAIDWGCMLESGQSSDPSHLKEALMADDNRNDEAGRLAAADETEAYADKAADGELSADEMSDATGGGGLLFRARSTSSDEDAGPDGRFGR